MRELVYYVAVSLDGFIAGPDGQFDAFTAEGDHMQAINERFADTVPTQIAEALGLDQSRGGFDTVLMGWNTYAVGLPYGMTSPYRHLRQIVFSRSHGDEVVADAPNLTVSDGDPVEVVRALKAEDGDRAVWLCGGGALAATLADEIDRLVLKRNPVVFGTGVPLFGASGSPEYRPRHFEEVATTAFDSGVVLSEYRRRPVL